jgi:hypothetical protein
MTNRMKSPNVLLKSNVTALSDLRRFGVNYATTSNYGKPAKLHDMVEIDVVDDCLIAPG